MRKPVIYEVGGCVRDRLLSIPARDIDYVVVGGSDHYMREAGFKCVGADFPVYLNPESGEEFALARKEVSTGDSYHDFTFVTDKSVTLEDDLFRRDLTINAIAYDPETGIYHDPYNGIQDIENKVLRHVSEHFAEDPLRVLRVARFAARYAHLGFTVHEDTLALMRSIASKGMLASLTPERVYKELSRAITEPSPDVFFTTLDEAYCLDILFPELYALQGQTQPEKHHPEVDTFVHQMLVLQQAAKMTDDVGILFAALCHGFGKGITPKDKLPHHHGHEKAGVALVKNFCDRLKVPKEITNLAMLTSEFHTHVHRALDMTENSFMRLLSKFDVFRGGEKMFLDFIVACEADARGRTGFEDKPYPQADVARKVLAGAKAATWDRDMLMEIKPVKRSDFIYRERLSRVRHALHMIHDTPSYRQYREQYEVFEQLEAKDKLRLLLQDKGNLHNNYVEQTIAIALLPEKTKAAIRDCASALQDVEKNFDATEYGEDAEARVAKRISFLRAIKSRADKPSLSM